MKPLIKYLFCSILYYLGIVNLILLFVLKKKENTPLVIIIYHRVVQNLNNEINDELSINHPLVNFRNEMKFIKKWFKIVSLDEAVTNIMKNKYLMEPTLAVTFDDGYVDNYTLAFPILKELNIPATIFLSTGLIGSKEIVWVDKIGQAFLRTKEKQLSLNSCINGTVFNLKNMYFKRKSFNMIAKKLKELDYSDRMRLTDEILNKLGIFKGLCLRMLNWEEVREMADYNITLGAHSMTHPILSKMPFELAKREILESKLAIENVLETTVKHFAFPNGRMEDFSQELKQYCQEIGFESVSTTVYGHNQVDSDVYALKRLAPGKNMPIFAFDLIREFLKKD